MTQPTHGELELSRAEPLAHHRCADPLAGDYCDEVTMRGDAFAEMVAAGDYVNADLMVANAARIAEVHRQEHELRQGRT